MLQAMTLQAVVRGIMIRRTNKRIAIRSALTQSSVKVALIIILMLLVIRATIAGSMSELFAHLPCW